MIAGTPLTPAVRWFYRLLMLAVLVGSGTIFASILHYGVQSDLVSHARFVVHHNIPANFLYYVTIYVLSGFSTAERPLLAATVAVLAVAVLARFMISARMALRLSEPKDPASDNGAAGRAAVLAAVFLLQIVHNLPRLDWDTLWQPWNITEYSMYLGKFPPNVWHNSTFLIMMPFALLLFDQSYLYLTGERPVRLRNLAALVVLNIIAKPSYYFVFAPVFPLFALARFRLRRPFWNAVAVSAVGLPLIAAQYLVLFYFGTHAGGVQVRFMYVWHFYSLHPVLDTFGSFAYPLLFILCYPRCALSRPLIPYALALTAVGVLLFMFLSETKGRAYDGNFKWQVLACSYILFLTTLATHAQVLRQRKRLARRDVVLGLVFAAHLATGVLYLRKMRVTGDYF